VLHPPNAAAPLPGPPARSLQLKTRFAARWEAQGDSLKAAVWNVMRAEVVA
jgi:hypothetical protein